MLPLARLAAGASCCRGLLSRFVRRHVLGQEQRRGVCERLQGLDLAAPQGLPLQALELGRVLWVMLLLLLLLLAPSMVKRARVSGGIAVLVLLVLLACRGEGAAVDVTVAVVVVGVVCRWRTMRGSAAAGRGVCPVFGGCFWCRGSWGLAGGRPERFLPLLVIVILCGGDRCYGSECPIDCCFVLGKEWDSVGLASGVSIYDVSRGDEGWLVCVEYI